MKKKILSGFAVLAIAAVAAWNVNVTSDKGNEFIGLTSVNIEALAVGEINPDCPDGCVEDSGSCFCFVKWPNEPGRH